MAETERHHFISTALTKRFAVLGGLIVTVAFISLALLHRQMTNIDLYFAAERNNVALTRSFSNVIWPRFVGFLESAHELSVEELRNHQTIQELRQNIISQMQGLSVVKVKIYDLSGLTVFSTDSSQIGEDKSSNAGFITARGGDVASELTHRDTFSAFEQVIENTDVLSSYIPIETASGQVQGVFEVYYDVTELLNRIRTSQLVQALIVGATFLVLYFLLIIVVWRSERQAVEQHRQNVELARTAAKAEEASRLKSEFLATMSHELRTPLNAILGFSESLKKQLFGPVGSPKYLEYASDIWSSGRHLLHIINDVLDVSRVESGHTVLEETEFDPSDILAASVRLLGEQARKSQVSLVTNIPDDLPALRADKRRLKQMFLNVLSNAVKFTPPGGNVTTTVSFSAGRSLTITVIDTGIGISKVDIPMILMPFGRVESPYTGKYSGTGLGLTIAKAFADLHGASFQLDSEPGNGTRICIEFPTDRLVFDPVEAPTGPEGGARASGYPFQ